MKFRNLIIFALILVLCLAIVACGDKKDAKDTGTASTETVGELSTDSPDTPGVSDSTAESDTDSVSTEKVEQASMLIGDADIKDLTIVIPENDVVAITIAEYFAAEVKAIAGYDIAVIKDSQADTEAVITIGKTSLTPDFTLAKDEYIIKVEDNKLHISYADGASPYQAITTILGDTLFSSETAVDNTYSLADGFETSGKCYDYIIGDNEFNPFE